MKKFIDLISCLFPNWYRFRKLYYEFEQEWSNMPELNPPQRQERPKSLSSPKKKSERKEVEFRETTPSAFKRIVEMQKQKIKRASSKVTERAETPKLLCSRHLPKKPENTDLPKIANSFKQYQEQGEEFLKDFLEDLQSYKGGNIHNTSATKFPKSYERKEFNGVKYSTPDIDFTKQMHEYRKTLISQEISKIQSKAIPICFQQKRIIPNLLEKIAEIKSALSKIEDDYNNI